MTIDARSPLAFIQESKFGQIHGVSGGSLLAALLCSAFLAPALAREQGRPARPEAESILDRRSHVEKELHLSVSRAPRLCDEPRLKARRISVAGCELFVEEEGAGVPLVLLHGGPGATHHYFHPYFSRATGFARIIYYDQRGCGASGYCPGPGYSVSQAADDLDRLREALKIERWVVLGHSYGGLLAQYYAIKYPERLGGLVLVAAKAGLHLPMKPGREGDFISKEESASLAAIGPALDKLVEEGRIPRDRFPELLVYNNFLNGDWKRQSFYKPSSERAAQIALYEWKHDEDFNRIVSRDAERIDLQGAFAGFPVPTLLMEGRWDLTWNTDKAELLRQNHPHSRLVMFKKSSHHPFEDEPELFFSVLKDFLRKLPPVPPERAAAWKESLYQWERSPVHSAWTRSAVYLLSTTGYGRRSNEALAAHYSPDWLGSLDAGSLMKVGMALYDVSRYEEALPVFQKAYEALLKDPNDKERSAVPLLWQGFMLDLQGKRDRAIAVYEKVASMGGSRRTSHGQCL